jgi:hypothetical protein
MESVIWRTLQGYTYTLISVQLFKESPHIILWLSNESTSQTENINFLWILQGACLE